MKKLVVGIFVLLTSLGNAQSINDALIGYWPFNGNANDTKGINNGIVYGGAVATVGKEGQENTAYYLDGVDDYIQIASPQTPQVTIAFWIKPNEMTNDTRLISAINAVGLNVFSLQYSEGNMNTWSTNVWKNVIAGYNVENQSKWSFVCLTIDANKNITGYLNGIKNPTENVNFIWTSHLGIGKNFFISGRGTYGSHFKGSIDELMIFDKVLSESEIQSLYGGSTNTVSNGWKTGSSKVYVETESVGIGTVNPLAKLDVNGKTILNSLQIDGSNSISSVYGFRNKIEFTGAPHGAIVFKPGEAKELMFGFHDNGDFYWGTGQSATKPDHYSMMLNANSGNLGIKGKLTASEVKVKIGGWADYVFEDEYTLPTLQEVENHIQQKGHLINIPSATEVSENGIELGQMNAKLLEKIEELTLYTIAQEKQLSVQQQQINVQQQKNATLEARLEKLESLLKK